MRVEPGDYTILNYPRDTSEPLHTAALRDSFVFCLLIQMSCWILPDLPRRAGSAESSTCPPRDFSDAGQNCTDLNLVCYNLHTAHGQMLWVVASCLGILAFSSLPISCPLAPAIRIYGLTL